jgi:protein TonB
MKFRIAVYLTAGMLAGCAGPTPEPVTQGSAGPAARIDTPAAAPSQQASAAVSVDDYKRDLATHISRRHADKVFAGRPQALLRSVVVLRYSVDSRGQLLRSEIWRSNRDRETEATALATLRGSAPFPKPAAHLLQRGRLDIAETWLFNNDGRFQLRSIAEAQMNE